MKSFSLPNLLNNPQVFCIYIINKKSYNFRFRWCDTFCLMDIYQLEDGERNYILKGRPLTTNTNLIERIKDDNLIQGKLTLENKFGKDAAPAQENFHTDFELVYYEEE